MVVNNTNPFFGSSFIMTLVIRSYPGALRVFRYLFCRLTSLRENGLIRRDIRQGVSRNNSLSLSEFLGGNGVNTCSRCLANTSASSLSLLAQLVSGFLIGGIGICGLLNFFVAFQSVWSSIDSDVM
jgi:hypothetical protein